MDDAPQVRGRQRSKLLGAKSLMVMTLPSQAGTAARLLDSLHARLSDHQVSYMARSGKYWQGLDLDLQPAVLDLGRRPTDQRDDWRWAAAFEFDRLVASTRVDVYQGPVGWGYVTSVELPGESGFWIKALAFGLETTRAIAEWTFVQEVREEE